MVLFQQVVQELDLQTLCVEQNVDILAHVQPGQGVWVRSVVGKRAHKGMFFSSYRSMTH